MNRRPLEPLDAEEAALAEQLARLGPHGEPSPRLDARILAAAHDAVSEQARPRRRSRWPLGLGVAASALLAVGIAWQLRPTHESPLDREFAAADADAAASASVAAADASAGTGPASGDAAARQMAPPPPPLESVAAPLVTELPANASPSAVYNPPAALPAQPAVAKTRPALPSPRRSVVESAEPRQADAPPLAQAAATDSTNLDSVAVSGTQLRSPATAALPPPPPAPPAATAAAAATSSDRTIRPLGGVVADPETYAEIAAQREQARAQHARNAAASAERQESRARRASEASSDMQDAIAPAAAATSAPVVGNVDGFDYARNAGAAPAAKSTARNNAFAPSVTRNSLKRTDLQLPVVEDTKLDADDWLERIRLRRDLGDRASAVESLLRFRQAHPFQKTPEDLQELLAE